MNDTIPGRVAAGAALLDTADPGWWRPDVPRAINLGILDLADPCGCVLGQRCPPGVLASYDGPANGPYAAWAARLSGLTPWPDNDEDFGCWAVSHGFEAGWAEPYGPLTAEWRRLIEDRRAAA